MRSDIRDRPRALAARRRARALALACVLGAALHAGARAGAQEVPPATRSAEDSLRADTVGRRNVGTLRPGDLLKIVVYRDAELTAEYLIDSRGDVQIPGLGVIRAAGLDPTEVHDRLSKALEARGFDRPEISVQPLIRVSVLGDVGRPAVYPVEPGTSLIQILTLSGGPQERANLKKTRIIRDGRVFVVDLESALAGSPVGRIVLNSNDVVVVPRRTGLTRETLGFALSAASVVLAMVNIIVSSR